MRPVHASVIRSISYVAVAIVLGLSFQNACSEIRDGLKSVRVEQQSFGTVFRDSQFDINDNTGGGGGGSAITMQSGTFGLGGIIFEAGNPAAGVW